MITTEPRTRAEAAYRKALARMIRRAKGQLEHDLATPTLEEHVRNIAEVAPLIVADAIEDGWERAANQWTAGNNSGNPETLRLMEAECDLTQATWARVCRLFGIIVQFPGLYPICIVKGRTYYSALQAITA